MREPEADDPVALRSERLFGLFAGYLGWRMSRAFGGLRLARDGARPWLGGEAPCPVVVYSNHPGWWDPIVFMLLAARLFPGRPGFGPMEAEAFARYGVFRRMGVFGIAPETRAGARRFLTVADRILSDPRRMMWITAEGTFADPRKRPVVLRQGIAHLARRSPGVRVVPLAIAYEFWEESRPEALVRFGPDVDVSGVGTAAAATRTLAEGLERTMDALADDVARRDPGRFETVVRGTTGADHLYDGWRRLRSGLRGERFSAAHGAPR